MIKKKIPNRHKNGQKAFFFKPQVNFCLPPKKIQNEHIGIVTPLVTPIHPCACSSQGGREQT